VLDTLKNDKPDAIVHDFAGIAYRMGWISEEKMRALAQPMIKNQYGQYLLKVIDELKREQK
jgi:glucose-1-phosphate thymidylyltransferase